MQEEVEKSLGARPDYYACALRRPGGRLRSGDGAGPSSAGCCSNGEAAGGAAVFARPAGRGDAGAGMSSGGLRQLS